VAKSDLEIIKTNIAKSNKITTDIMKKNIYIFFFEAITGIKLLRTEGKDMTTENLSL
jgi:hypothetical protein